MRAIATALRRTYEDTDGNRRDSRVFGFVPIGTWSVATSSLPAWMIVSSVYVYFETTATWIAASRLYARKPDVVSGTSVSDAWRTTHEPAFCSRFFSGEKCSIVSVSRSPTTRSARPSTIGRDELRDVRAHVLVVGVGVDDDVGAELQARVEARLEAGGEALVVRQLDDVVDAVLARDLDRPVGRAVVDDEPLDDVDAGDLAREVGQRRRERLLLVEAGDLDDELHTEPSRGGCAGRSAARDRVRRAQAGPPATLQRTLGRPRSFDAWLARRSPGRDRASPRFRPPAGARCRGPGSPSPGSSSARRSASSSGRRIPNYDSYYSLLWGREVLHGTLPSFDAYRAPTEHPLAIAFGALLSLVGDGADRVMVGATFASFVVLAAGDVPPRAGVLHAGSSASSPPRCCARASTSRSSRRGRTSTSRTSR